MPPITRFDAADRRGKRARPGPGEPGQAYDFAGADLERNVVKSAGKRNGPQRKERPNGLAAPRRRGVRPDSSADNRLDEPVSIDSARVDHPNPSSVSQYGDAIGDRAEPRPGDGKCRRPPSLATQAADQAKQEVDLALVQRGSRLVEQKHLRPLADRLGDCDLLAVGDVQFAQCALRREGRDRAALAARFHRGPLRRRRSGAGACAARPRGRCSRRPKGHGEVRGSDRRLRCRRGGLRGG